MKRHVPVIKALLKNTVRRFKSLKITAFIIILLILLYLIGLIVPQKRVFDSRQHYVLWLNSHFMNRLLDFVGFTDIYTSPLTLLTLGIFFINLFLIISIRIPLVLERMYLSGEPPSFSAEDIRRNGKACTVHSGMEENDLMDGVGSFFKVHGWGLVKGRDTDSFVAVKNRFSPIGFLLFHVSFVLCLIGGLLITYTRFSGYLALAEGEAFDGEKSQIHKIVREPSILKSLPPFELNVESIRPFYENNTPAELRVGLRVGYRDDEKRELLRVNAPIKRGPISIIVDDIDVAPLFIVKGPSGRKLEGAYVKLNVLNGDRDSFSFEADKRFTFYVRFFPDYALKDNAETSISPELKNPAMNLTIIKEGRKIYDGVIKQGESADMGPFTIGFEDVRYWVKLKVIREYGKTPLMAGFLLALIGLIMRLVFYQKTLRGAMDSTGKTTLLYMDGKSEFFRYSFQNEINTIAGKLDNFLKGAHDENI